MIFNLPCKISHAFIVFFVGIVLNIGIAMNPGYFSHDEISWGLKVFDVGFNQIEFSSIFSYNDFHYRPLNFNLWLFLSYFLYDKPQLFHFFVLCWGVVNSILFYSVMLKLDIRKHVALIAAVFSTCMPSIVFVNGWIGTIGDIAWLFFCFSSFLIFLSFPNVIGFVLSLFLFVVALMFKETAVVYPGFVFIYLIRERFSSRKSLIYFLCTTLIFIAYIYLRFDFLFAKNVAGYSTSLYNIPLRLLEYFLYPFLWMDIEIHGMFSIYSTEKLITSLLLHVALIFLVCRASLMRYFYYISLYFVASVPMLILASSLPHYMYGAGYVMAGSLALLISRDGFNKYLAVIFTGFLFYHSISIQRNFVVTGLFQNNMNASLYSVIKSDIGEMKDTLDGCYEIIPDSGTPTWMAIRALYNVNKINGINILTNQVFLSPGMNGDATQNACVKLRMEKDGHVYEKNQ